MYVFTYFNSNNNKELIFKISAQMANFSPFYRLFKFLYKSRALTVDAICMWLICDLYVVDLYVIDLYLYVVDAICDLFTKYL